MFANLVSFQNKFKMTVLNPKFDKVVELFLQHVSSRCIDCSKMNKLGVSINVYKLSISGGKFSNFLFDYEVELYDVIELISNPEIRNQTLTIFGFKTQIL